MITADDVRNDDEIRTYIQKADGVLDAIGYTEHGMRHVLLVADTAGRILRELGHPPRRVELATIAGLMHDIGNIVGRAGHEQSGALLAGRILLDRGMPTDEVCDVMSAIGNHEVQPQFLPVMDICAALVLADKADVHHTRVRPSGSLEHDIHDRINGAARESSLVVNPKQRTITLGIKIDAAMGSPMEYFEIFLARMVVSRRAAEILGCQFELFINDAKLS